MSEESDRPALLSHSLESERIHSAYLFAGSVDVATRAAIWFARGAACTETGKTRPCEDCSSCHRSIETEFIEIDTTGKSGPLYRNIGDHPDLFWVDRGDSTRVAIRQIREIQNALRLGAHEDGWRVVVVADAQWLSLNAQNALLHLLEEPPDRTCVVLVTPVASALLATIRSRCQRVRFAPDPPVPLRSEGADEEVLTLCERFDGLSNATMGDVLDWAEAYRGNRATAAEGVEAMLATGSEWLRESVHQRVREEAHRCPTPLLDAFDELAHCRRELAQRNANPQMVAERAFLAMRRAVLA